MNICLTCKREFNYKRSSGGSKSKCNSCCVNDRRFKIKVKIVNYLGGSCCDCGYSQCYGALEVHHLDPSIKEFNISGAHARSWKKIVKELETCILLCSNCHRERHHNHNSYNCDLVGGGIDANLCHHPPKS
jgi:hypothetical protein